MQLSIRFYWRKFTYVLLKGTLTLSAMKCIKRIIWFLWFMINCSILDPSVTAVAANLRRKSSFPPPPMYTWVLLFVNYHLSRTSTFKFHVEMVDKLSTISMSPLSGALLSMKSFALSSKTQWCQARSTIVVKQKFTFPTPNVRRTNQNGADGMRTRWTNFNANMT